MSEEFRDCLVDLDGEDIVGKFKALNSELDIPFGLNRVSDKSLVKYIVSTYDLNSPFVEKHFDWAQRRRETAKFAEFPKHDKYYIEEAEEIIFGHNGTANHLILWYMFVQNDIDFIRLQAYQSMYYRQIKASMGTEFDKPSDYDKLKQNIDNLTDEIKRLHREIFHGEETVNLKKSLYNFVANISTDFRPEDVAERLQDGESAVDVTPYGDYEPDDLKFVDDA